MTSLPSIRRNLISKRVKAGVETPVGRRLTTLIGLVDIEPVDEDHDRRRRSIMGCVAGEVEALIAGGAQARTSQPDTGET